MHGVGMLLHVVETWQYLGCLKQFVYYSIPITKDLIKLAMQHNKQFTLMFVYKLHLNKLLTTKMR